jgi:anti-sigma B factor antagonist
MGSSAMNEPQASTPAQFRRVDAPDAPRLTVSGEVDLSVAGPFQQHLGELLESASSPALVDLSDVTFMDSSGLAALATAQRRAQVRGAEIVLLNCSEPVQRVIEITGLDAVLRLERCDAPPAAG